MKESARPRNTSLSCSHHFSLSLSISSTFSLLPINSLQVLSVSGSRSTLGRGLRFFTNPSYGTSEPSPLYRTIAFSPFLTEMLLSSRLRSLNLQTSSSIGVEYFWCVAPANEENCYNTASRLLSSFVHEKCS